MISNSITTIFFTLLISNKLNIFGYDFLFHLIPIYYLQFINVVSQIKVPYSQQYKNFCNFFRYFFFDVNINKHENYRRLLEITDIDLKDPIIHFKIAILLWGGVVLIFLLLYLLYRLCFYLFNKKANLSFTNNLLKIFLITYCSLSTLTINYLIYYNVQDMESFIISIVYTALFIIGVPIFIIYKLESNKLLLNVDYFEHQYNCIYYIYKYSKYRFTYFLFAKNIIYSIVVSIHHPIIQNSLLLLINVVYLFYTLKYDPYDTFRYKVQSYISSISTIIIICLNYVILMNQSKADIISYTMILVHCVTIIMYSTPIILLLLIKIKEKLTNKKVDPKYIDIISNYKFNNEEMNITCNLDITKGTLPTWVKRDYVNKSKVIERTNIHSDIPRWAQLEYIHKTQNI